MRRLRFFSCRRILAFTRNPSRLRSSRKYSTFLDSENTEGFRAFQGISPPTSGEFAWLGASGVTNAGLAHLAGCESLRWLDLSSTQVTDEGPKNIKDLPCLQTLILASCDRVTGSSLKGVKSLRSLNLSRATDWHSPGGVTDANLEGIKDLHGLETFVLSG